MYITHGKTIHFEGMTKPKEAQLQGSTELANSHTNPSSWSSRKLASQVSTQPDSWSLLPSVLACPIRLEDDTCLAGVKPFLAKLISIISHVTQSWDDMTLSWKVSASCLSFLLQPIWSRNKGSHDQAMKASGTTWNQFIIMPKMCTLWFMDQAHEPQIRNLRDMWFRRHQRDHW